MILLGSSPKGCLTTDAPPAKLTPGALGRDSWPLPFPPSLGVIGVAHRVARVFFTSEPSNHLRVDRPWACEFLCAFRWIQRWKGGRKGLVDIEKLKEKESEGIGIFFYLDSCFDKRGEWKILLIFLEDCCSMTVWGRFLEISLRVLEII